MLKIKLNSEYLFSYLHKSPLKKLFVYDINKLSKLKNETLYNEICSSVSVTNSTAKTTYENRFSDLDQQCLKYFSKNKTNKVHDVAVSSGITSVELQEYLVKNNLPQEFHISDKYATIILQDGFIKEFFDVDGNSMFLYFGPIFCSQTISKYFVVSRLLYKTFQSAFNKEFPHTEILLLHPRTQKYTNSGRLKFIGFDLFGVQEHEASFDFIRCMNILNPIYFSTQQLNFALKNLFSTMKSGAILLVGRTNLDQKNHASFFKKENSSLIHLEDFNNGSEIKEQIKTLIID